MTTNNPEEINKLREGGKILATVLANVAKKVKPGITAKELDTFAEAEMRRFGAEPSFKNYRSQPGDPPFPAALCVSINDEVVHGIPTRNKVLRDGDIVGLDAGVWFKGLCTDHAITVPVGKIDVESQKLIEAATESLTNALNEVRAGVKTGDIGFITEHTAKKYKFNVVRELVGHGVGKEVHEAPEIPCYGKKGTGTKIIEGMVLAIEPMINAGHWKVHFADDNWTIVTSDGSRSAHMEHTVLVTKDGCEILTKV